MKKLLLIGILTICIAPAFADNEPDVDILANASDVSCDSGVLQTASGSSTLEANWSANTVHIKWYDGDNEIQISDNDPCKTCQYDGVLTLPTAPTKAGYTFAGWRVRQLFDLSTWEYGLFARYQYETLSGYRNDSVHAGESQGRNTEKYGITNDNEWVAEFENGVVKGIASCNNVSSGEDYISNYEYTFKVRHDNTFDQNTTGTNCWCKAIGYAPHNDAGIYSEYMPVKQKTWVLLRGGRANVYYSDDTDCADGCASKCAMMISLGRYGLQSYFYAMCEIPQ